MIEKKITSRTFRFWHWILRRWPFTRGWFWIEKRRRRAYHKWKASHERDIVDEFHEIRLNLKEKQEKGR